MNPNAKMFGLGIRGVVAVLCALALVSGDSLANIESPQSAQVSSPQSQAPLIPPDQLDSLVAPIALYPDPLLAQTLVASTYPLELVQLHQWLVKNSGLKDKALADAVAKQPWDPSIQAMAALPDLVKRLADDIQWTTDLGNAFLAQQSGVMDAVQRMRKKAQDTGNFKSTEQQKVETKVIENKSVIVVEQANPQVVYVPSYDPYAVYGPPIYPYPPIYYPPAGYYAAGMAISFGVGLAMGAAWGGGWGWGAGWGGNNNININNNNNFVRNSNISGGNRNNIGGGIGGGNANWKHNPQHRGGAPYRDKATADRFGGTSRGDSLSNRQATARDQVGRQGGNLASNRGEGVGGGNRGGNGIGSGNRPSNGVGAGNRPAGAGADSIGGRDVSRSGGGNREAFGGGSRGYNGSSARSSSSRGSSSMGSRGGGGGGSRGGGGRGGGGRRR
jgi:Protein of unknown function (DUF3300)